MVKYKSLIKYVFLFFIILIFNMIIMPIDVDEIWCYGFSLNIGEGLIPYKDFNMVQTPFYFMISSIFMLFGKNILYFHIVQALIFTGMSYFLFELLGRKSWLLLILLFLPRSLLIPGYNLLLFFLCILLIYLEKNRKSDLLIGVVIALSVLTKQSIGIFFIIPTLIFIRDKKSLLKRLEGFIIPCILFLLYLIITNSFNQFIDLCFLGLFDFAKDNGNLFTLFFFLSCILLIITIIFIYKNGFDIFSCYILMFYSVVLPMFGSTYFQASVMGFLFLLLYYDKIKIKPDWIYIVLFVFVISIQSLLIFKYKTNFKIDYPNIINHFEYRLIDKNSIKITNSVNKYIKDNNINKFIFMDCNGFYFKIINDIDIQYIDHLNTGNWGYNGSSKVLKEIKKKRDYVYFVDENELNRSKQTDRDAINYVIKNGKKIDSILFYDVYILE